MSANWEWKEYFIYLDALRESGVTNMFGAVPYLQEGFPDDDLTNRQWGDVMMNWMENYDEISKELGE
tara:strand:+ start:2431 stop:2631 length:201 start_codon:yes stop_codon:yes gene_type:complete